MKGKWAFLNRANLRGRFPRHGVGGFIERRSRVHVEVWAHGERLDILNRCLGETEEKLKASCDTFTTIGRCHNLDTQGQRAEKEKCRTVELTVLDLILWAPLRHLASLGHWVSAKSGAVTCCSLRSSFD